MGLVIVVVIVQESYYGYTITSEVTLGVALVGLWEPYYGLLDALPLQRVDEA